MKPMSATEYCSIAGTNDKSGLCWTMGSKSAVQDESLAQLPMCFAVRCDSKTAPSAFLVGKAGGEASYTCPDGRVGQCVTTVDVRSIPPFASHHAPQHARH